MPRLARRSTRKPRRALGRRAKPVKRRARRTGLSVRKTDRAVVVESQESPIITNGSGVYTLNFTTQLSDFQRAQEVAHAYKWYRCAKVELIFVPYATFAQTNGAVAARMPQLYYTLDRVNNMWIVPSEAEMLERGISPKLFKRTMKFSYRPNLLQHVQLETGQPRGEPEGRGTGIEALNAINSIPLYNKWLPTQQSYGWKYGGVPTSQTVIQVVQPASNPYALKYYGSVAVIDIEGGNDQQIGDLMTKVTWEFKGPRALVTNAPSIEPYYSATMSMIQPGVVANQQPTNYP